MYPVLEHDNLVALIQVKWGTFLITSPAASSIVLLVFIAYFAGATYGIMGLVRCNLYLPNVYLFCTAKF